MYKEKCNILIIGTLASGSSALKDMLREYDNINVIPGEFNDYRAPGLVGDQLSEESIKDYPDSITDIARIENRKWRLFYKSYIWRLICKNVPDNFWNKEIHNKKLQNYRQNLFRLNQIYLLNELHKKLKSVYSFEEKIDLSRKWIQSTGNLFLNDKNYTLFDQPIFFWSDPEIWTKVYKPFKLICVFRDPKDQFAEMIKRGILYSPFRSPFLSYGQVNIMSVYGNDRNSMMNFHKDGLKKRLEKIDYLEKVLDRNELLLIDFEGLILNYDVYKSIIETFLGDNIKDKHIFKRKYFNPEIAKNNSIGIYRNYLTKEDLDQISDLEDWYNNKISTQHLMY
jgi:hypothetical protein